MNISDPISTRKQLIKVFDDSLEKNLINVTLADICSKVINSVIPYEDAAEVIEDKAYAMCEEGNIHTAINQLTMITDFFEGLVNKNEENCRDLADVYLLIGQMFQFTGKYNESIMWFTRSIVVDDQYPVPYHNLAISYKKSGKIDSAIRCLKQEILLAPGNYYSYLFIADLYEFKKMSFEFELCLNQLLERDHDNILGLHRLIKYYEKKHTSSNVLFLYRRLQAINKTFNTTEWLIKLYYLCREKKMFEALALATVWLEATPQSTIAYLVKAHIYGVQKKLVLRKNALRQFTEESNKRIDKMKIKIEEFGSIFGSKYMSRLSKSILLMLSSVNQNKIF